MAALRGRFTSGAVALTTATAKTCIQFVAPANQRVRIRNLRITLDGATNTYVPAQVRILRQTTAGTFTNATNAPVPIEKELTETFQTNYQTVATAEPTAGDVLGQFALSQYLGLYERDYLNDELIVQGGGRIGIEVNATFAAGSLNARIDGELEE